MDCSLGEKNSIDCLDESIKNLTNLAGGGSNNCSGSGGCGSGSASGSPLKCSGDSTSTAAATSTPVKLRRNSDRCLSTPDAKSHTYRISMANLEETQESELDAILGELSLLEAQIEASKASASAIAAAVNGNGTSVSGSAASPNTTAPSTRTHSRTNSTVSGATTASLSGSSESGSLATHSSASSSGVSENGLSGHQQQQQHQKQQQQQMLQQQQQRSNGLTSSSAVREPRTESPDNDSAFSDTVSLLSSESSASSSASSALHHKQQQQKQKQKQQQQQQQQDYMQHLQFMQQQLTLPMLNSSSKAAKIQLALHKLEHASIRRLFVKAFTVDGASKSLLVDERMTCGYVARLLADKNHVQMQSNWALVENLGDLQMERLFEDHELLVDNLMTWNADAGNRVLFQQRADKIALFVRPEIYLPGPQMAPGSQHDEQTRAMLLEEFFESNSQLHVDGPLYMKADSKKGWKRYHFVLRSSGLYYFPKEKTKNIRDLACLTLFNGYNVYRGLGWKKKWKAPTDYTFGFKSAVDSSLGKACRTLRMLCAEDLETMEKWITAIRISKYGKQLWENHKAIIDDLNVNDGMSHSSFGVSMRSDSISSISSAVPSQCGSVSSAISSMSASSSGGRMSRASSSSSSGCLSDENNGFESEFTTGTIKRKPSMKPNLQLTAMSRQLKEVGENMLCCDSSGDGSSGQEAVSPERSGTLTRRHSRRKSQESNGSGTLKRRQPMSAMAKRGSEESMNAGSVGNSSGSSNSTPTPTPSICAKPLLEYEIRAVAPPAPPPPILSGSGHDMAAMINGMSSSTLSLDSLPPPPPPPPTDEMYGSQLSLASLPPPPPPEEAIVYASVTPQMMAAAQHQLQLHHNHNHNQNHHLHQSPFPLANAQKLSSCSGGGGSSGPPPVVPAKPIKPAVKAAPPYKSPPDYVGQQSIACGGGLAKSATTAPSSGVTQKKVSFADSPVLLRRKMCSPEPRSPSTPTAPKPSHIPHEPFYAPGPLPPPRADLARLSTASSSQPDYGSPKRLQESTSNPPRDFLKDLQRVMRKKWQVAQKCKLEPATTPHEVLGFRDFSEDLVAHNLNTANAGISSHYYRETANVSNWVQEHYGAGIPPPPLNEYALYENVTSGTSDGMAMMMEPQFPIVSAAPSSTSSSASSAQRKKRPPPPPPKRSDSTHLTHRVV